MYGSLVFTNKIIIQSCSWVDIFCIVYTVDSIADIPLYYCCIPYIKGRYITKLLLDKLYADIDNIKHSLAVNVQDNKATFNVNLKGLAGDATHNTDFLDTVSVLDKLMSDVNASLREISRQHKGGAPVNDPPYEGDKDKHSGSSWKMWTLE